MKVTVAPFFTKRKDGTKYRAYKYRVEGAYLTVAEMKELKNIQLIFGKAATFDDRLYIEEKWRHKLWAEIHY